MSGRSRMSPQLPCALSWGKEELCSAGHGEGFRLALGKDKGQRTELQSAAGKGRKSV